MSTTGNATSSYEEDPIIDDVQLLTRIMEEVRRGLRQASYFKRFKRGQIVLSFEKNGSYSGLIVTLKD